MENLAVEERVALALEMHDKTFNCAQCVALAVADLVEVDRETLFKVMEGFGAGMGLPNMKKYTDRLQIDTVLGVGTTLTMRIDLH